MPTYQYACTDPECGNRFELVQSFTDPAASECPVCQHAVRKVYGSVGVVFKGSGFYRNDSRAAATTSDGPSSSGDSAKSESTSDAKSAPKSESKSDSKSSPAKADTKSSSAAASA
jgi:putative FmdB family regulatory protein